jgi:sugar phosphate isomerase/epimerase
MKSMTRRGFIKNSSLALGTLAIPSILSQKGNPPYGFQSFAIRDRLSKDFAGTLKEMAAMGYQTIEMCSPKGYAGAGFASMIDMKPADMKKTFEDNGFSCPSCHFTFDEMRKSLDERIEYAKALGLKHMIASSFWLKKDASIDDYMKSCDELNQMAVKINAAGMQAGFHNHDMEFEKRGDLLIYDEMLKRLDPKLVKMQFQTQVIVHGYKAADYFTKYPGRFISSHLSDWTAEKKQVPIGQGLINWPEFYKAAKASGVQTYYVEMDYATYPDSAKYLDGILK